MQYNNTKDTEELLLIFASELYSMDENGLANDLKNVAEYYSKHTRHQYHIISHFVYEKMEESKDSISYILNNIDSMLAFLHYRKAECEKIIASISDELNADTIMLDLEKLYDHIALEEERIKNNAVVVRDSNREIEENVFNTFNSIMNRFQDKVDEISNSLNANIITVVGLFSAIIFVFFGGITSLSDMVNGIWNVKFKEELTIPLLVILVIGLIIFNTIFLLLYCIAKIVDKNIGSLISRKIYRLYYVEKVGDGCYAVFKNSKQKGRLCMSREKAERKATRKNALSFLKSNIQHILKKIFFRFPYVVFVNIIMITAIIYLYIKL